MSDDPPRSQPDDTVIRPARPDDAPVLARLVDIAGEGLPMHLWSRMADPGEQAMDVGIRRAAREDGAFSYRNATVIEADGRVAGMLVGYRLDDPYDTGDLSELPEVVRPLVELEAEAPGSWYVNVLAVLPEFQGRGLGPKLLQLAERRGGESGATRMSIIVADANPRAARLYEKSGYRETARRPVVTWPDSHGGDWVLLIKDLPPA